MNNDLVSNPPVQVNSLFSVVKTETRHYQGPISITVYKFIMEDIVKIYFNLTWILITNQVTIFNMLW